jgi:hypothetical protein
VRAFGLHCRWNGSGFSCRRARSRTPCDFLVTRPQESARPVAETVRLRMCYIILSGVRLEHAVAHTLQTAKRVGKSLRSLPYLEIVRLNAHSPCVEVPRIAGLQSHRAVTICVRRASFEVLPHTFRIIPRVRPVRFKAPVISFREGYNEVDLPFRRLLLFWCRHCIYTRIDVRVRVSCPCPLARTMRASRTLSCSSCSSAQ